MLNYNGEEYFPIKSPLFCGLFICIISILFITNNKILLYNSKDYFHKPMTDLETKEMMDLLEYFMKILNSNNIEYFMNMGTLIGSVRHHGMVPWDDDIDICINENQKNKVFQILTSSKSNYKIYNNTDILNSYGQWKFYSIKSSRSFVHRSFKWPYIDIFFYSSNATHIFHESLPSELTFPKTDIYPLIYRPFDKFMLPSPCNYSKILKYFGIEQCRTRSFSHLFEMPLYNWWQRVIPCRKLYSNFPFVFVETSKGLKPYFHYNQNIGIHEELIIIGNRIIGNSTVFQLKCSGQRI